MREEQWHRTTTTGATTEPYVWGDPLPERPPRSWRKSASLVAVAVVVAAGATYLITTNGTSGLSGTGTGGGIPGGAQGQSQDPEVRQR